MKKILFLLVLFLSGFAVQAQKIDESEVPSSVMKIFRMKMTDSIPVKWERNDTYYTALFSKNKLNACMVFSENAEWFWTRWEIPTQYIPKKVKAHLTANYADYKVNKATIEYKATQEKTGTEFYLINLKKKKEKTVLRYTIKGEFVGVDGDKAKGTDKPNQQPNTQEK